jgi:hypothetical protein
LELLPLSVEEWVLHRSEPDQVDLVSKTGFTGFGDIDYRKNFMVKLETRVTRLGEFSPSGWFFTLAVFSKLQK